MSAPEHYDDGRVALGDDGVLLRRYYFPVGSPKRISYREIRGVELREMGWLTGRGRVWGTAYPGYWLPLDLGRVRRHEIVVLDLGGRVKPAFTPDDPATVVAIIERRSGA